MSKQRIIVIVPCYNEEGSLGAFVETFDPVRTKLMKTYNIDLLLVNDGSSDRTQDIINRLTKKYSYIYYRHFAHNAGHQSALRAGLNIAENFDAAIMMDSDLQHPPGCIPDMLREWERTGANLVQMLRNDSAKEVGLFKYWTSRAYYWAINALSGLNMEYGSSDFRLIDGSVIRTVAASPERDLFLRGYFSWLPVKRVTLDYKPNKRFAGQSKYTLKKMLNLAGKGVLQFSEKPLTLAVNIGLLIAFISFVYGVYLIVSYFAGGRVVSGWTSLMVSMLFCFGINFILLGFIGKYLAHAISLQKQRPEYIIAEEYLPDGHW